MKTDKTEEVTMDTPLYTISVAAQLVGVSVHTLRMYEKQGLLLPFKKESKHRMYSQFDISRLKCIRDTITNHKFTISGIKGMLSLIPCWKIINCSDEERNNCSAYNGSFEPCWSYMPIPVKVPTNSGAKSPGVPLKVPGLNRTDIIS